MNVSTCLPVLATTTIRCRVAAGASLCAGADRIAHWRKQPVAIGPEKKPISFLKHADDQTVLGLMAVAAALEPRSGRPDSFASWGVIAAANLFGRVGIARTIQRYRQEGAWGVSPNLIPHQSLHAISGTISQALKIYGPNFGIGGGPNAMPDAFLIAGAMMMDRQLPGLWLVLTGYETEWIPAPQGDNPPAPACQAVALALTPADAGISGLHLSIGQMPPDAGQDLAMTLAEFQLGSFADEIAGAGVGAKWRLDDAHWVELEAAMPNREGQS